MVPIQFRAALFTPDASDKIGAGTMLRLPKTASEQLPSKGMTMIKGTLEGYEFQVAVEPDGKGSHWFRVRNAILKATGTAAGDTVELVIGSTKEWPEPKVPADFRNALAADPKAAATWNDITPMARWDWIRWIGATRNPATRERRVEVGRSKLRAGKRRPCCFNRTECTLTEA